MIKGRLVLIIGLLLAVSCWSGTAWAQDPAATYTGPAGVTIKSYSKTWSSQDSLKKIYTELVANFHGDEIAYLGTVNVYGGYPRGNGVAGLYQGYYSYWTDGRKKYSKTSYIDLYGGDEKTEVGDFAKTLAHEYGHHFTNYYLWMKEGKSFDDWNQTGYGKIRGLVGDKRVSANGMSHQWNVEEIAAEDYVQLFGSPLARKSKAFENQYGYFNNQIYNLSPQENLDLPLAAQVKGLEEYWLSLSGLKNTANGAPLAPKLALVGVNRKWGDHLELQFSWTRSLDDNSPNLEYTLVYYGKGDTLPAPIKTLMDGYEGTATITSNQGHELFRVFVKDSRGKIVSSNVVDVDLANPVVGNLGFGALFRDVGADYWAYEDIKAMVAEGVIKGYQDHTFKPENPVTRGEFASLLVRAMALEGIAGNSFSDTKGHWSSEAIEACKQAGIINGYEDGSFKPDRKVTRAELAAMLVKALGLPLKGNATDLKDLSGHWAVSAVEAARAGGLVSGYQDGTFRPDSTAKRSESAVMLKRFLDQR